MCSSMEMRELGTVLEHLVKRTPIDTFTASSNNDNKNSISTKRKHSGKIFLLRLDEGDAVPREA